MLTVNTASARGRRLVERRGAGKAPTAFRIWKAGENEQSDGKTVVFSERSAKALLAEQSSRGLLYSFDFDHRSVMPDSSPEAGKAAGWHVLEVRRDETGAPELWAASCDWTSEAREGLEAKTPEWRYFSPAYYVDPQTREVISYVNCALTNTPLTRGIPALASATESLALARARCRALGLRSRHGRPRMSSTLATAREKLVALTSRSSKQEAATPAPHDDERVLAEIATLERNHMRSLGREVPPPGRMPSVATTGEIEAAGRAVLATIRK